MVAHRLDQPQGPKGHHLSSIFWDIERHLDVALRAKVINFVWVDHFEDPAQSSTVGQIAVVQGQFGAAEMGIMVKVVDSISVEEARAPDQPVDFVTLLKQKLGKIGA